MNVRARDEFLAQALDPSKCFLCGNTVSENARTAEHVFPKWMQKEVELWNRNLTLLNGTVIPYRQLTITCCHDCNHFHLGKLRKAGQRRFPTRRRRSTSPRSRGPVFMARQDLLWAALSGADAPE